MRRALPFGKEGLSQAHDLKMQLDKCSNKVDVLRKQKSGIFGQVRDCSVECHGREKRTFWAEFARLQEDLECKKVEKTKNPSLF